MGHLLNKNPDRAALVGYRDPNSQGAEARPSGPSAPPLGYARGRSITVLLLLAQSAAGGKPPVG